MTILIAGGGAGITTTRAAFQLMLAAMALEGSNPSQLLIDSMSEIDSGIDQYRIPKGRVISLMDRPAEVCYSDYGLEHHYHNLTAPTVTFDRLQQRRKALARQHFVKPLKKAKKREKRFVKVNWR